MPVIEVPFAYKAGVVGKGKRKEIPHVLMSSVMVEVATVSAAEAPLALRWHRDKFGEVGQPPNDYRRLGDDLFTPVFYVYSGRPDHHVTFDEAVENVQKGWNGGANPLFGGERFYSIPEGQRIRAEDLPPGSSIRNSEEEAVAAEIRATAADLVSVDGQLFKKDDDGEPVYEPHDGYIWTKRAGRIEPDMRDIRTYFRVDQVAEALAAARVDQPEERPGAEFDFEDPETYRACFSNFVEVFDPSVLNYRPDQAAVLLAFSKRVVASDKGCMGDAPVERMIAYAALRDATLSDAGAPVICDLLEAYADKVSARGTEEWDIHHRDYERNRILEQTRVYRMSPVPEEAPLVAGPRP